MNDDLSPAGGGKIIPFGKYKGQEIEVVRQRDPQYLQWLMQQAWFAEKFQPIYQIVVNNFAPPSEDTPAHNALQVRFLEHEYRAAFWRLVDPIEHEYLRGAFHESTKKLRRAPQPYPYRRQMHRWGKDDSWRMRSFTEHRDEIRARWAIWRMIRKTDLKLPIEWRIGKARFEDVTDVVFEVILSVGRSVLTANYLYLAPTRNYRLGIEIKPSMGDDYPAVLRQMKQQKIAARLTDERPSHWFLLVGEFAAAAATLDQVRQIFAQDNIRVVLVSELP